MKIIKLIFAIILLLPFIAFSQSIEITTFNNNPLEVNPLIGGNLKVNYKYSSEAGSTGNHIYIGLEILDANNTYVSTVKEVTLNNQTAGTNLQNSVDFFIGSNQKLSSELPTGHYYQVKAAMYASGTWTENASTGYWNTPKLELQDTSNTVFGTNKIAKGADISWMTEMESDGYTWRDNSGTTKELLPLLKEYQLNAVRLRVWVNPDISGANGWCDIDDFVAKAKLAKAQNMDIMVTIHYSDWWADPGKQNKPASWSNFSVSQLETAVANHTTAILNALNAERITPKWIQIGNETNDGLLWSTGKASTGNFNNYAKFLNAGSNAVKTFNSAIKTILHLSNGNDNALFRWNINGLLNNGLVTNRFDIIGMSLYPDENNWISKVDDTFNNMVDLKTRYNKEVMMVEVGFSSNKPDVSYQFLTYMIEKTKQAEGLGVFYWEPIVHKNWKSYSKGAWDADGSPSIAMDAFISKNTLNTNDYQFSENGLFTIIPNPSSHKILIKSLKNNITSIGIYDVNGKEIQQIKGKKALDSIDVSKFKKGIYILKINNSESIKFLKN
ncbi:glycosyl hydrolase 53 family protein [Polaribacter haliotis]|uniref:Arabinogalactan endo-beta-1,4-galactanase n=1 Tax=Polaribacter haliotis TaxID=1888915 RepID=A0A7L8AIX1_9FLAO|nr:glycosyl hydrolase 53 family protein [Polaribacter haliotis]QOD61955.1 glycosyl hydrolase 53 family protein [Polaribacter haliotis]